jgi:hypothetical protein
MKALELRLGLLCLMAAGCAGPRVNLPNTIEANECARQCLMIENQCEMRLPGNWHAPNTCSRKHSECRKTCPGAHAEE